MPALDPHSTNLRDVRCYLTRNGAPLGSFIAKSLQYDPGLTDDPQDPVGHVVQPDTVKSGAYTVQLTANTVPVLLDMVDEMARQTAGEVALRNVKWGLQFRRNWRDGAVRTTQLFNIKGSGVSETAPTQSSVGEMSMTLSSATVKHKAA